MKKTIEISTELYESLGKIAQQVFEPPQQVFKTPQDIIELLVNFYESKTLIQNNLAPIDTTMEPIQFSSPTREFYKLEVNYYPRDLRQFKSFLLKTKKAWVQLSYKDGTATLHEWNSPRFSESSDVRGNLNSGYLRHWREKEIVRADVAIDKNDLPSN